MQYSWGDVLSTPKFRDIRCPRCGHKLMEAFGLCAHLVLRVKCPSRECRDDIVQIGEGFQVELLHKDKVTP